MKSLCTEVIGPSRLEVSPGGAAMAGVFSMSMSAVMGLAAGNLSTEKRAEDGGAKVHEYKRERKNEGRAKLSDTST